MVAPCRLVGDDVWVIGVGRTVDRRDLYELVARKNAWSYPPSGRYNFCFVPKEFKLYF